MTILKVSTGRTPDSALTEWAGNKCYVDRQPNYNVYIPRLIDGERLHTKYMTGASPDVREVLRQTAVVYVADTGQYLEDLPANPTGLRVAFIHNKITTDRYVTVEVRTGVDWEILVESQLYTVLDNIATAHPPSTDQLSFRNVTALPDELDRSAIYLVPEQNNVNMFFTGSSSFDSCENINRTNLFKQIREAEEAYSNIVRLDTIQQMDLVVQTLHRSSIMVIADASGGDSSVTTGMAIYLYDHAAGSTVKIYEWEGSDIVLAISGILDAPATGEELQTLAVTQHVHNAASLEALAAASVDPQQNLVVNDVALANGFAMHIQEW